jgi:hypothetical protein
LTLGRVVLLLLALDVALAWLVMAGAVIFAERMWLVLGGSPIPGSGLAEHVRQFVWLRRVQLVAIGLTVPVVVVWARRARPLGRVAPRLLLGWWWAAVGGAAAAEVTIRLTSRFGQWALAPGGLLPLLMLGEILKIAAAVLTMAILWRVHSARRL